MKITYIHHSCFVVEIEDCIFVFDYYKGKLPVFNKNKKIIIFSSHRHSDHFNINIFQMASIYPEIYYILSDDICLSPDYKVFEKEIQRIKDKIFFVHENRTYEFDVHGKPLKIETLNSTDEGVSFILQWQGKTIYHAGDLNWWSWKGESDEDYYDMTERFKKEIDKIKDRTFDIAFLVLDPRQKERYWWGFDYYMKNVNIKRVFPMHFWMKYEIINELKKNLCSKSYLDKIVTIRYEGETFNLKD